MLEDINFLWKAEMERELVNLMKRHMNCVCDPLTVNEGAIEPLNVIVFGEGEEDLTTNDWERQEEDGTTRHCQGEGAQVQSANVIKHKQDKNTDTHTHVLELFMMKFNTCRITTKHLFFKSDHMLESVTWLSEDLLWIKCWWIDTWFTVWQELMRKRKWEIILFSKSNHWSI